MLSSQTSYKMALATPSHDNYSLVLEFCMESCASYIRIILKMYLAATTLCLLLLPLGAPQLTETLDSSELVLKCDDNLFQSNHGYINGSACMPEDIQKELVHFKNDIQTELDEVKQRLNKLEQGQLQYSQGEEMHFQQIHNLLTQNLSPPKGAFHNPVPSCKYVPQNSSSGKYWIQSTATGYASHEYCDMNNTRCGTRGWMRVASMDMSDTMENCPAGFRYAFGPGYRGCGTYGSSCVSTTLHVHGVRYGRVCGRINAYQSHSPNAFHPYYRNRALTIDSQYVEGVSLTHGQYPRKHIWTFAAALDETQSTEYVCPCTKTTTTYVGVVPPFIGQDYFCETGSRYHWADRVYTEDPLWDGHGCGTSDAIRSSCCSFNNPPWFCKTLSQSTTDDIELRSCVDESYTNEDIILKLVEVYIQ